MLKIYIHWYKFRFLFLGRVGALFWATPSGAQELFVVGLGNHMGCLRSNPGWPRALLSVSPEAEFQGLTPHEQEIKVLFMFIF